MRRVFLMFVMPIHGLLTVMILAVFGQDAALRFLGYPWRR
jgi:hypothetical protein